MQASGLPRFLAQLLFGHIERQVRLAGREHDEVVPIINVAYSDNAPMITVGVTITTKGGGAGIATALDARNVTRVGTADEQLTISVPALTQKEKAALDQLLPADAPPPEDVVKELGFSLKPSEIDAYHRFYRHYPVFSELVL
jgi:hypothetical protein